MRLVAELIEKILVLFKKGDDFRSKEIKRIKRILKKFKNGNAIKSEEELKVLQRYYSTGMVHFGFNYKTRKSEAILTRQGRWFAKQL